MIISKSCVRKLIKKSQNPLFFYDNDLDGFCSFILLKRVFGKGVGFIQKTVSSSAMLKKINENSPDLIVILDIPSVPKGFFDSLEKSEITILYIDHHKINFDEIPSFVNYYNPLLIDKKEIPVTEIIFELFGNKQDSWISLIGCVSDRFLPDYYSSFLKEFPDLGIKTKDAFTLLYESEFGKIIQMLDSTLRGSIKRVAHLEEFMIGVKSPYDILKQDNKNKFIFDSFLEIDKIYQKLLEKARANLDKSSKVLFFEYSGKKGISSVLANRLIYEFPDKFIFVFRITSDKVLFSARGKNIKKIFEEVSEELGGVVGGGHDDAIGGRISLHCFGVFKEKLLDFVTNQ